MIMLSIHDLLAEVLLRWIARLWGVLRARVTLHLGRSLCIWLRGVVDLLVVVMWTLVYCAMMIVLHCVTVLVVEVVLRLFVKLLLISRL